MTNDFAKDFAQELADYFLSGTDITAPPTDVYITLYNGSGTELNGDLQNGRVSVSVGSGFNQGGDATQFENANEINFGETTADITVQEFAIKDQDADDATAFEYFRTDVTDAPQDYASGTRVFYESGELSANILDNTND